MKFSGIIGFYEEDVEVEPGVYVNKVVRKSYKGDIYNPTRNFQNTDYQNDKLVLENRISIVSDIYLRDNLSSVRYVEMKGAKWEVRSIDINNYPRVILSVGGVYNDNEGTETSASGTTE